MAKPVVGPLPKRYKDLTNQTLGRLTAIKPLGVTEGKDVVWEFKCKCGNTYISEGCWVTAQRKKATNPEAPSCGCLNKETTKNLRYKHGMSNHPLFWVWVAMLERCYNPKSTSYHKYGAKGVTVCDEWKNSSKAFMDWALANGWQQGLHLDKDIKCNQLKIDKQYSPETCMFITPEENGRMTSRWDMLTV